MNDKTLSAHPDDEALAAYLSGPAAFPDRQRLEDHLLVCDACRRELVAARRSVRREERRAWATSGGALAAAGIAALILVGPNLRDAISTRDEPVLRGPGASAEGVAEIPVRSPRDGVTISAEALVFSWAPVEGEALYVLTVVDQAGDLVWEERTLEVSTRWPSGHSAPSDQALYWFVDALVDGNRSATSGVHDFRLR